MAAAPVRLPSSNSAGNNQTSPPMMGAPKPGSGTGMPFAMPQTGASNPYFASTASHPLGSGTGAPSSGPGGLYDPSTSPGYAAGQSNIDKQLVDMYGKGVGGMLDNLLKGMSGQDSQIFKDWLASMKPVEASERAQLQSTLGAGGVSANSSVSAIANSNLEGQFNAQASGVSAQLQQQEMQNTMNILMGMKGDAAKEVATSGWSVFGDILEAGAGVAETVVGGMTGNPALMGAGIQTTANGVGGATHYSGNGAGGSGGGGGGYSGGNGGGGGGYDSLPSNPMEGTSAPQLSSLTGGGGPPGGDFGANWSGGADSFDASIFDSAPANVQYEF